MHFEGEYNRVLYFKLDALKQPKKGLGVNFKNIDFLRPSDHLPQIRKKKIIFVRYNDVLLAMHF